MKITTVGIDLAKNVFQVHGVMSAARWCCASSCGATRWPRSSRTCRPCLVGMEACGSAHHWARKLQALGHTREADGAAVRQAVRQEQQERRGRCRGDLRGGGAADMRFVPIKNVEQQSVLALHRVRQGFVKARTAQANQIRGLLGEFGLVVPQGIALHRQARAGADRGCAQRSAGSFRLLIERLLEHLKELRSAGRRARGADQGLASQQRAEPQARRRSRASARSTASALVAIDRRRARTSTTAGSSRLGWAWCRDSTPAAASRTLLGMSKRGDAYLRTLLIHGARSVIYRRRREPMPRQLAGQADRAAQQEYRRRGAGQQERANRLGAAGARSRVPSPTT